MHEILNQQVGMVSSCTLKGAMSLSTPINALKIVLRSVCHSADGVKAKIMQLKVKEGESFGEEAAILAQKFMYYCRQR